jgi:hypothetical protein
MAETPSPLLAAWSSFYIMTGSSAAALTGLMFVVITLMTGRSQRVEDAYAGVSTFSTPTVMHFVAAFLISAVLVAPWHSLVHAGAAAALIGLVGIAYILRVMHRTRRLTIYTADVEDWMWYTMLPLVAYGGISASATALVDIPVRALFVLAAGVVLLISIGIRNAWDVVTYLAIQGLPGAR